MSSQLPRRQQSAEPGGAPQASAGQSDAAKQQAEGIERRRHPRIRLDAPGVDTVATAIRSAERKPGGERAGGLRDNVGWTVAAGRGNRAGDRFRFRLKKSRIVVLGIAMVAGGIAAVLASQAGHHEAPIAAAAAPGTTTQILVASKHIAAGERLSTASLAWAAWPEKALQTDYITEAAVPAATTDMAGQLARSEFLPGDPIRQQKLTRGSGGFLSAALDKGMRGVSVVVTAESASGGFVSPDDRVDVVLTRTPSGGIESRGPRSETILRNVRVLAINAKVGEPGSVGSAPAEQQGHTFSGQAIATLALAPGDADLVVSALAIGKLSLLLRPIDASDTDKTAKTEDSANQAIRMSSPFWLK